MGEGGKKSNVSNNSIILKTNKTQCLPTVPLKRVFMDQKPEQEQKLKWNQKMMSLNILCHTFTMMHQEHVAVACFSPKTIHMMLIMETENETAICPLLCSLLYMWSM